MKKGFFGNRGISPLLSTVLLIGAVIILALAVWLFLRNTVDQYTGKIECGPQEGITLDFSAECLCSDEGNKLEINVINNGQQQIDGIMAVTRNSEGSGIGLGPSPISIPIGEENKVGYEINGCPQSAEIFPYVVKEKRAVACSDQTVMVECLEV